MIEGGHEHDGEVGRWMWARHHRVPDGHGGYHRGVTAVGADKARQVLVGHDRGQGAAAEAELDSEERPPAGMLEGAGMGVDHQWHPPECTHEIDHERGDGWG